MKVTRMENGDGVVIVVDGELDLATVPQLRVALVGIDGDGDRPMTIDLADCTFIDSTAISVMVEASRRLEGTTRELRIANLRDQPKEVFTLTQVGEFPHLKILEGTFDLSTP